MGITCRNSFEDGVPFTELPPEPVQIDPPLAIPKDLRPLGDKRRYMRTIQLIPDDDDLAIRPTDDAEATAEHSERRRANDKGLVTNSRLLGTERRSTCRHHEYTGPAGQRKATKKLVRIASHVDVRGEDKTTRERELLADLKEEAAPDSDQRQQQHESSALDSSHSRNCKSTSQLVRRSSSEDNVSAIISK